MLPGRLRRLRFSRIRTVIPAAEPERHTQQNEDCPNHESHLSCIPNRRYDGKSPKAANETRFTQMNRSIRTPGGDRAGKGILMARHAIDADRAFAR
jgi:hypothetical protein